MRLNRIKCREKKEKKNINYHLLFFVVLPLSAITIGYIIAEFIVIPKYIPDSFFATSKELVKQEEKPETNVNYTFPENKGLYFQLGSFTNRENAEAFCEELRLKDVFCTVWKEDRFVVLTGGMMENTTMQRIEQQLNNKDVEFFAREIVLPSYEESLINEKEKEKIEDQMLAIQRWMKTTLDYVWMDKKDTQEQKNFIKSTGELSEKVGGEVGFIKENHPWNKFVLDLVDEFPNIVEQPSDRHQIYQIYDHVFQSFIKIHT